MKLLEKHLSTRISMGKRHCNLGIYWSKAGLLLVLAMYVCACGNRQRNGTPTQANDSIIVEVPQQVGVGSILPVTVTGESDFEIKKVQITGTFQNSSSRGYELRIWTAPKRDISVFSSQYQRHWGDTKEGILSTYDISNYYLYIKYLTADDELIACEMFSPYSNMSDLVNEKCANPKYYTRKMQTHPAGEWCHPEGTLEYLHTDKYMLITRIHHIEITKKSFYNRWLNQH